MILAAGLGTRLRPLTLARPKPLVPIVNRPLLGILLDDLQNAGFRRLALNTHHLAGQIARFIKERNDGFAETRLFYEPEILGAGGGIKNTEDYWEPAPLLVINGDVLTDIDLGAVYQYHLSHGYPVTVVTQDHVDFNQIAVNDAGEVVDFYARGKDTRGRGLFAFTGIQVIDPVILRRFPSGPSHSIETYQRLAVQNRAVKAYFVSGHIWEDIGDARRYARLHERILNREGRWAGPWGAPDGAVATGNASRIDPNARTEGWASVGNNSVIGENALIKNTIIWDRVVVEPGSRVVDSVVADGVIVRGDVQNQVLIREE